MSEQTTENVTEVAADAPAVEAPAAPETPVAEPHRDESGLSKGLSKTQRQFGDFRKEQQAFNESLRQQQDAVLKRLDALAKGSGIEIPADAPAAQQVAPRQAANEDQRDLEAKLAKVERKLLFAEIRQQSPHVDPEKILKDSYAEALGIFGMDPDDETAAPSREDLRKLNNLTWTLFNKQVAAIQPKPTPNGKTPPPRTPAPPSPGGASVTHKPATRIPTASADPFEVTLKDMRSLVGLE